MNELQKLRYWKKRSRIMLNRFNLRHWGFKYSNTRRRLGGCVLDEKYIELSKHYVILNDFENIDDTLRHEIAHALTLEEYGHRYALKGGIPPHGKEWKKYCRVTGANPRSKKNPPAVPWRYLLDCPSCGGSGGINQLPKNQQLFCGNCSTNRPMKVRRNKC